MDLIARLLVRMARWSRKPPSTRWLIAAGAAIALSVLLVLIEVYAGWPDALRVERLPRFPGHR
ncbi:MAG TPA: hypothetical protein VHG92_09000 [Afifellaceae bacterium]|nr:hypothetical protein [Afifellaceae bacterium]